MGGWGSRGGGGRRPEGVPRALTRLLEWVCPAEDRSFVLSDLRQEFEERCEAEGLRAARRWYRDQVARSILPCLGRRIRALRPGALGGLGADVRYASRRLAATPMQALVTVISLGIGIGVTTAIFTVGNAFLFQTPGGLEDTEGLVALYTSDGRGDLYQRTSFPDYRDIVGDADLFAGLTAVRPGVARWTEGEVSERLIVEIVTGNYFDILGVRLPLGRGFLPEETVPGRAEQVVVLAHRFWEERLAADPGVLGRAVRLNGRDFTVVGVAPKGLIGRFLRLKVDAWVPVGLPGGFYHSTPQQLVDRSDREYLVYGRLRPGVTLERAQAQVAVVADRLLARHADSWQDDRGEARRLTVLTERDSRIPPSGRVALKGAFGLLLAGGGAVLLIACINVAGLFLARAARRRREVAVRLSLGASRSRVVRLLLVEALLVALVGGGLGVWLASLSAGVLGSIPIPLDVPLAFAVGLDGPVLAFALAVSLLSCLAFGLVPALQATKPDLTPTLRDGGLGRRRRIGLRGTLVVVQVAVSVILLVGAGLALRTAAAAGRFPRALDPSGIALVSRTIRDDGIGEAEIRRRVLDLAERVAADPVVEAVSIASVPELSPWVGGARGRLEVEGYLPSPEEDMVVSYNAVTPGYFEMVGMQPARGRLIDTRDQEGSPAVALVNETFARRYWPGDTGLGRRFRVVEKRTFDTPYSAPPRTFEVVGVLPDVRVTPDQAPEPFYWTSYLQDVSRLAVVHARGRFDAASVVPVLRREVVAVGDDVQLVPPRTYEDLMAFMLLPQRLASRAFGYAGMFALLLAVMGIYGIVSFAVSQRTREMAIRQAIGAGRGHVVRSILLDGMRLAGFGMAIGLAMALGGAYLARSGLMGISPVDPAAVLGGVGILLGAAFVATWVPARRVTRADPMRILRDE
ncbi:MAG: ADOP family duplicated permease [Gemmatimonadota bacterium]